MVDEAAAAEESLRSHRPNRRRVPRRVVPVSWLVLLAAGMTWAVISAWWEHLAQTDASTAAPAQRRPPALSPKDVPVEVSGASHLMNQLALADEAWRPKAIPLPNGGTRYTYRRRPEDPPLNLEQIKQLLIQPESFERERQGIENLLQLLRRAGVLVVLGSPRLQGAAGEWEPRTSVVRVRADVPSQGTREFLRVLNHEAIHVAQSCRAGSLLAAPALLGLPQANGKVVSRALAEPLYASASPHQRALEAEAYAHQESISLVDQLLRRYCQL